MGTYLNPGNIAFAEINNSGYVDKTGLISRINEVIETRNKLVCISRPRRFGKSYSASMLSAYYDCSCQSESLFDDKQIARDAHYRKYLNQYNVICFDVTSFVSTAKRMHRPLHDVPGMIVDAVLEDVSAQFPWLSGEASLTECLIRCAEGDDEHPGRRFVFIIDEWDALIREAKNEPDTQDIYLNLLREWFKNISFTPKVVAAAYMTGILPIKKDGSQSAISDFGEFSMIKPRQYGEYVGFTEEEVRTLCEKNEIDFRRMKEWYDGYDFPGVGPVYNPNSVIKALTNRDFDSYWTETSAAEGLMEYISKDFGDLTKTIAGLIGGVEAKVNTTGFANDLTTFKGKDDVLTLLIHLGYLAYDSERQTVRIPNEEIRREFQKSVRETGHADTIRRLRESDQLLFDTIHENTDAVAAQIEKIHLEETAPLHYNREDSLRSVIKLAYYTYHDHYVQFEELPAGAGYADVVYLPKYDSGFPILLVELKWNQSAHSGIEQIRDRQYQKALEPFGREILYVCISYDKDAEPGKRKHTCRIERHEILNREQ